MIIFSVPDSVDWSFGKGDFTLECWIKPTALEGRWINQFEDSDDRFYFGDTSDGNVRFIAYTGGTRIAHYQSSGTEVSGLNTWYHVAAVRSGSNFYIFVDGVSLTLTVTDAIGTNSMPDCSATLDIAKADTTYFSGYMDGVRISRKARYTTTFTPPTTAFTDDINTALILNADINQGTWAEDTSTGLAISTDSRMKFDGSGDYLSVPHTTDFDWGADNFTVECWANFNSLPSGTTYGILNNLTSSGSGAGGTGWQMDLEDDSGYKLRWQFWDTGGSSRTNHQSFTPALGQWYHIAVVRNSDVFTTYIDGTSIGSTTLAYTIKAYASAGGAGFIGANRDNSYAANNYLPGYLDEIRYSDTARYTTTFTPQTRGNPFTADANTKLLIHSDYTGGLGADSSGNYNNFTATNLVATDQVLDTPTNNFCTVNPIDNYYASASLSEGNLKVGCDTSNTTFVTSTFAQSSGKWYCEIEFDSPPTNAAVGISAPSPSSSTNALGGGAYAWGYQGDGLIFNDGYTSSYGNSYTTSDIVGIALDLDNNKLYFSKNGTWQNSGDPTSGATGTGAISITDPAATNRGQYYICFGDDNSGDDPRGIFNFGQDSSFAGNKTAQGNQDGNGKGDFYYEPPSGYLALCTANLSTPEIKLPGESFGTVAYDGNESYPTTAGAERTIDVGFQPDFSWLKKRNEVASNRLFDSIRGSNKALYSNANAAEAAGTAGYIDRWVSTGPVVKAESDGDNRDVNVTGGEYVIWNWKAGGAPTATNSAGAGATPTAGSVKIDGSNLGSALAGTIPATKISANTTSGFSIVTFEGTGSNGTVAHGLSQAPELIIVKNIDMVNEWPVGTTEGGLDFTDYLKLDGNRAFTDDDRPFNDTDPTASVFSVGTYDAANENNDTILAYCFHSVEAYSKVGSYKGNSNADGTFIYTGFKPAYFMFKSSNQTDDWFIMDNKRNTYNLVNDHLKANSNAAGATTAAGDCDFVSNGIKFRVNDNGNNSGYDYIYLAFAESPFKYSNAR